MMVGRDLEHPGGGPSSAGGGPPRPARHRGRRPRLRLDIFTSGRRVPRRQLHPSPRRNPRHVRPPRGGSSSGDPRLFGVRSIDSGEIHVTASAAASVPRVQRRALGIGLVSEDRKVEGLVPMMSVARQPDVLPLARGLAAAASFRNRSIAARDATGSNESACA